jgi:tetratricopeptide (TPR) repeat protein
LRNFILLAYTFFAIEITAQTKTVFEQAIQKLQVSDYEAAIKLLDQVITTNPNDYPALYNRAVAKSILRKYDQALLDINRAITEKKESKKAFLQRGIIRKKLTDYDGALADFDFALKIDTKYSDAFYNKGVLFEHLEKFDEACDEFRKAKQAGSAAAYPKVDFCETPLNERAKTNSIIKLETISTDKTYGYSKKNPVKVGTGANGAIENEQTYLELLRDQSNLPITYKFKGKCCDYFTKNAPNGKGFLSQYEILYTLHDGKLKTSQIFLTHFDYEKPQILSDLKTIK